MLSALLSDTRLACRSMRRQPAFAVVVVGTLALGIARRSELAVRASLGASRGRLVAQLITESVVLAVPAGLCGLVLSVWLQRLLPIATGLADSGVVARE